MSACQVEAGWTVRIAKVYLRTDDSKVTVFDEHGHLMPDYGGHIRVVVGRILRDAPQTTRFYLANLAVGHKEQISLRSREPSPQKPTRQDDHKNNR
jgi:hypothetical protein